MLLLRCTKNLYTLKGDIMYRSKDLSVISIIGVLSVIRLVEDEFVL